MEEVTVNESILISVKQYLGIDAEDTNFDLDIITHINSVLMILNQLGVGPSDGFYISDKSSTWNELLNGRSDLEGVKTYIYMKVKLVFDPPMSSAVLECLNRMTSEYECRLRDQAELGGDNNDK